MNKVLGKFFDQGVVSGGKPGFLNVLILCFLAFNLVIRFCTIFNCSPYNEHIAAFFGGLVCCCIFVVLFPKYLKAFLFLFGFSFFLYGFGAYEIQSRVFELIVTCVATALLIINHRAKETHSVNRRLVVLILCYVALSLSSLLLLPVTQIVKDFLFFGFPDAFYYLFIAPPYSFIYPVAAVIRLMLFSLLAVELSKTVKCRENYIVLFKGIFVGVVFCSFLGILDLYGLISLAFYRFGTTEIPGVLHSTFLCRSWFGEFVVTATPFVLIGFIRDTKGLWRKISLFGSLVICEIALILSGGRSGYVSYPFILAICWIFFYFSKEQRLLTLRFRLKDLIKVGLSLPITIAVSFGLIFFVMMPISGILRDETNIKKSVNNSKANFSYLRKQGATMFTPSASSRPMRWKQGLSVGIESAWFGNGYESYAWHCEILSRIPHSHYGMVKGSNAHTPHSIFFQLFVSGGIVGLCLWLMIVGYAVMLLFCDLRRNKRLLNTPVIVSIISFHMYGIFQSMQYVPMIWSIIFLCLGYAMTMDEGVLPVRFRRVMGVLAKGSMVLVAIGFLVYLHNFESRSLAQKYDNRIYALNQDRDRFAGFFELSKRKGWNYGEYRWFSGEGAIYVPGGGAIELEFHCRTPNLGEEQVVLTVSYKGEVLDEIVFQEDRGQRKEEYTVKRIYDLPVTLGEEQELLLEASRTWIPHEHLKNFDRRKLGVGVRLLPSKTLENFTFFNFHEIIASS